MKVGRGGERGWEVDVLFDHIGSLSVIAWKQAGTPLGGEFVLLRQNKKSLRGLARKCWFQCEVLRPWERGKDY